MRTSVKLKRVGLWEFREKGTDRKVTKEYLALGEAFCLFGLAFFAIHEHIDIVY